MTDNSGDPATLAAEQAVKFVDIIATNAKDGQPLLPLGYGINVNIPELNCSCKHPEFIQSRFTVGSGMPLTAYNETSGLVQTAGTNVLGYVTDGSNQ